MGILNKLILLFLSLFMTGCYEDFTPDIDVKPVLCINSLITAGEPIEISVTHTRLYTDTHTSTRVEDAIVEIQANDKIVDEDYIPKEGDIIKITAISRTYGNATAEVTVPVSVPIGSVEWEPVDFSSWGREYPESIYYNCYFDLWIKLRFTDPADKVNFYHFSYEGFPEPVEPAPDVTIIQPTEFYTGELNYELEPIFSEHLGILDAISGGGSYGFTFFTDSQFSGKEYTLNLQYENVHVFINTNQYSDNLLDCSLKLTLTSISRSYYNWSVYKWNVEDGILGDFQDVGLGNAIWGYSNVSTGAGVVAAQTHTSYTIDLHDFLKSELKVDKQ